MPPGRVAFLIAPSKLETQAVTSHAVKPPEDGYSDAYRAAVHQRETLLSRLEDEDSYDLATPLSKCGKEMVLICTCCGRPNIFHTRCNRKWCPTCARALAARASARYTGICESMRWPLFVTLTVKNWRETETDFVRHLRRSFGKLRRLRWFTRSVAGGIAGIEVTNTGKGWHPHIHAVMDCRWLGVTTTAPASHLDAGKKKSRYRQANREVCDQWTLCTGLPSSVKTKRASAHGGANDKPIAMEVLKYSVKGSDLVECNDPISPVLRMLDGTRLITSWGSCYGHLREHDPEKVPARCDTCGKPGQWMMEGELNAARRDVHDRKRQRQNRRSR